MSDKELAIKKVMAIGKPTLIHCSDAKNQESTRVILYHLKRKMLSKGEAEILGITKFEYEGELFIKVFKRSIQRLYELNENGVPVLMDAKPEDDVDLQRQLRLMRKDGRSQEEMQEVVNTWGEGKEEESPENIGIDSKPEKILSEKEEMKRMLEEG